MVLLLVAVELRPNAKKVVLHAVFLRLGKLSMPLRSMALWRGSCTGRALLGSGVGLGTGGSLAENIMYC